MIKKLIAVFSASLLTLGFAFPVLAQGVYVKGGTNVNVGVSGSGSANNGDASGNTEAGTGVNVGIGSADTGTTSGSSGNTNNDTSGGSTANVDASGLVITRADIDSNTVQSNSVSVSQVHTDADLSGYVASQMKNDTNISAVESASDSVAVTYKQREKLFGFIPIMVDTTATVDASGNISVNYPWYAFLMVTHKADLETKLHAAVNANTSTNAAAKLSANAQAKIVQQVKAVLESELNASANASVSGNAQVK